MKSIFLLFIVLLCSSCNSKKAFVETHEVQSAHGSQATSQNTSITIKGVDSVSAIKLENNLNVEETIIEEGKWFDRQGNIQFEGQKKVARRIVDLSQRTDTTAVSTLSTDSVLTVTSAVVDSVRAENTHTDIEVRHSGTTASFIFGILFVIGIMIVGYLLLRKLR